MAAVLSHIYTISTVFFTLLVLALLLSFRTLFKFLSLLSSSSSPTTLFHLIEEKLPSTLYNNPTSTPSSECCSVCLSKFEQGDTIRKPKCKHTFHKDCLDRWLEEEFATTCPLCRREVLPKELAKRLRLSQMENTNSQYDGSDEELIFLLSALQGSSLHTLLL